MTNLHTFQAEQEFIDGVVQAIHSSILKKTEHSKIFRIALSGGSTPGPIYRRLAEQDIPWDQVEIYLVDERYVPLDDQHSNYRMIRETLVDHIKPKKMVYFDTSLPIKECIKKYEAQLDSSEKKFFDLILLGIGTDGHTASLFPKSPVLEEQERWVAHTTTDQFDVPDRITLTFPALESAQEIFFLIKGKEKLDLVKKLVSKPADTIDFPVARLLQRGEIFSVCSIS